MINLPDGSGVGWSDILSFSGGAGILIVTVWLVLTGRLVPRSVYKDIIAERDYWRKTAMTLSDQNRELMVSAEVTTQVLAALPVVGSRDESAS